MRPEESFGALRDFVCAAETKPVETVDLGHSLVIICPDCGKQVAFRGCCPKCGGSSWMLAGEAGGIATRRMKALMGAALFGSLSTADGNAIQKADTPSEQRQRVGASRFVR